MISRLISRVTILITHVRGLISPFITTHEPPGIFILLGVRGLLASSEDFSPWPCFRLGLARACGSSGWLLGL